MWFFFKRWHLFFFSTFRTKSLLLYVLVCHCHDPFGCTGADSTSSLPCWLECFMELGSVRALDLKCEASARAKPTTSGVSCLPPRSLSPLYLCLLSPSHFPPLSLAHFQSLWWATAVGKGLWSAGLTAPCQISSPRAETHTDPGFQLQGSLICNPTDYCPRA